MTRYYYAMSTPRGANTYSGGDQLCRFGSAQSRDKWVSDAFESVDYVDQCKRDTVTRENARRWYPRAFAPDVQVFPPTWAHEDYWDDPDAYGVCWWTGSPTGGEYANL